MQLLCEGNSIKSAARADTDTTLLEAQAVELGLKQNQDPAAVKGFLKGLL